MSKKINFKTKQRLEQLTQQKQNSNIVDTYIERYNDLTSDELIVMSKNLIQNLSEEKDYEKLRDYEAQYESILKIMEPRKSYKYNMDFINYPDYEDDDFEKKIYYKKEFNYTKSPKLNLTTQEEKENMSKRLCDPLYDKLSPQFNKDNVFFNLTNNQQFLKLFLSPDTQYNSMLLFHGTGVGKTCTSISIAEQYSDELARLNKKIIILLNPSIKDNFIKNIFNIEKVKKGLKYYQCTGSKYIDEITDFDNLSHDKIQQKVNKIIKSKYEFYGYQEFANKIEKIKDKIYSSYNNKNKALRMLKNKIDSMFSNSFFIIDEAHNIKDSDKLKVLPPLLSMIFKFSINNKLLLLSATPMFDNAREIIWLMNLLLTNDKKPTLDTNNFFDGDGNFIDEKRDLFLKKIRGYISYVRGENPYRFPQRIYPLKHKNLLTPELLPNKDKEGKDIPKELMISELKLINCEMQGFQKNIYLKMIEDKVEDSFSKNSLMCSNITFHSDDLLDTIDVRNVLGAKGLNNLLKVGGGKNNLKYSFNDNKHKDFFKLENLKNYSSKIHHIIENIDNNEGIIFIYSKYIDSGVLPLALALEYNGYSKYDKSIVNDGDNSKGKYLIISGKEDLSKNAYVNYLKLQSKNKNGEEIKVIIGSETASEGLDFSYIRHIYILDPWFHLNKIEQVIGRGIRNCSHIDLEPEKRNVTIYLLVSTLGKNPSLDNETTDIEIYRKAEIKSKQMAKLEYLIKISCVDCNLNINSNKFETDIDYSKKCNYQKCDYKCINTFKDDPKLINEDTWLFSNKMISVQIDNIVKKILLGKKGVKLFNKGYVYNIDNIVKLLNEDKILIYLALQKIILDKITLTRNGSKGNIIYKNGLYIFVRENMLNKYLTYNNIRLKSKKKYSGINITNNKILSKKKMKVKATKKANNNSILNTSKVSSTINSSVKLMKDFYTYNAILFSCLNNLNLGKINMESFIYKYYLYRKANIPYNLIQGNKLMINNKNFDYDEIIKCDKKLPEKEKKGSGLKGKSLMSDSQFLTIREDIIKHLIIQNNKNELDETSKKIFNNLYNILYSKTDVYYKDMTYKGPNNVWGYKIINKSNGIDYIKFEESNNSFTEASKPEIVSITKSFNKKKSSILPAADIIGYYELKTPQNNMIFKIRNKIGEGKKGTQIKTGSICNNDGMKKETIVNYINTILGEKIYNKKSPSKLFLCNQLEAIFKFKDLTDDKNRWFYGPEETIEYKINEKK